MLRTILIAGISTILFACNDGDHDDMDHDDHTEMNADTSASTVGNPIKQSMDQVMQQMHAMKPTGNNDADYAMMMMEHHKGAVAMANIQVERGSDTALKSFARKVVSDQQKEIAVLQAKISGTPRDSSANSGEFMTAMYGTMTKLMNDSTRLYNNIDQDFAAHMIPHHQSAVDMARVYLQYGKDAQLRKLSEDIIKAQESEIAWLKQWLNR